VTETWVVEATYELDVAENEPETAKPYRVLPALEKDRVKEAPAVMFMLCVVPSAAKVLGDGLPPFTVTVAVGAELLIVTVMGCKTVFTVKVAVGELVPSVARTVCAPAVDVGTVKEQLNPPLASEVTEDGDVACVAPSYSIVIVEEAAKPFPVIVTVVPMPPLVGLSVIDEVTVKVPEAALLAASVTCMGLPPELEDGTVNVTLENDPVLFVVTVVGEVVTVAPLNFTVIVELAANPWPEIVIDVPTGPVTGVKLMDATTLKVAVPAFPLASTTLTV
jgi:hypothetical protein